MRKWYKFAFHLSLLFVVSSALVQSVNAQISIVRSDFESLHGTRQTVSTYDATSLTGAAGIVAAGGTNQTWDFTTMTWSLSAIGTVDYLTSWSGVPGADDPRFASATVVTQAWDVENPSPSDTSAFIFQQATDTGLYILGISTTGDVDATPPTPDTVMFVNDPASLDLELPYTFGVTYSDSTDTSTEMNGTPFLVTTNVTDVEVDGWGTLVLPSGSYPALRSYRVEKTKVFGISTYHYYYEFLTKGYVSASIEVDNLGNPIAADYEIGETALPVELTSLTATLSGSTARLAWATLSETDNAGFYVQHRAPGGDFADVGFVGGLGTTDKRASYSYEITIGAPGVHRFRLRQVDVDGTYVLSPVTELVVASTEGLAVDAYPNPFSERATVVVSSIRLQVVSVDVYDVLGRRVQTLFSGAVDAGQNKTVTLTADDLTPGLYFVRVTGDGSSVARSILVER